MKCRRVLVIGLDGATFDVLRPMCETGCMPNFAALLQDGATSVLRSTQPSVTPVAWSSFLTGCGPECHGIWDFRRLDPSGTRLLLNTNQSIRCQTLLDLLAEQGRSVVSINLPMTYPPRRSGSLVVGGFDSPSTEAALAADPQFARSLRRRVAGFSVQPVWRSRPRDREALDEGLRRTDASFRGRAEAARIADTFYDWSLMIVQFQELDGLQHRLWDLLAPDSRGPATAIRAVRSTMKVLDGCIGDLVELAERRGALVCVISDHGFGPYTGTVATNEILRRAGVVRFRAGWDSVGHKVDRAAQRLRKWLHRKRQPGTSTAMLGRSLRSQFPLDWRRTLAWSPHGDLGALIYLNAPERFGMGPVKGGRHRDDVIARVSGCLREAREPQSERPLFEEVIDVAEQFDRDPVAEALPDMVGIPAQGVHTHAKGQCSMWVKAAHYAGTHRREGICVLHGPGIRQGVYEAADMQDVAPTLLELLGVGHNGHASGNVLAAVDREQVPRRRSASQRGAITEDGWSYTNEEQAVILQRLHGLGYLQ